MPALSGQVISTLTDANGNVAIVATWFYDQATGNLRNGTWTSERGTFNGALIADNATGRTVKVNVANTDGTVARTFSIPTSGRALSAADLAAVPPPNGPVTTNAQLSGLTFDLT